MVYVVVDVLGGTLLYQGICALGCTLGSCNATLGETNTFLLISGDINPSLDYSSGLF